MKQEYLCSSFYMVGSNLWNAVQTSYKLVGTRKEMKLNIAVCDKLPCRVWNAVFEMLFWEWPTFKITVLVLVRLYLYCCSFSGIKVKEKRFLWAKEHVSRKKEELPSCVENWDCTKKKKQQYEVQVLYFQKHLGEKFSFVITYFIIFFLTYGIFFWLIHLSLCSQDLFS